MKAQFASLTGSPFWGKSLQEVVDIWTQKGWKLISNSRPVTIYGPGPLTYLFETKSGRQILWIPGYGSDIGEDWKGRMTQEKLFWVLREAGVKVLLVGGTSGICDFRTDDNAIRPGDMVLPWSFRTSPDHRGLPKTDLEMFWPKLDVTLGEPFCTELSSVVYGQAEKYIGNGIRRIYTPKDARVALVVPDGITYESNYDIRMWRAINKLISDLEPDEPPVVTLHGDCINPPLARAMGIHLVYYHLVANYAQGLGKGIVDTLYPLYLREFPSVAIELEWDLLDHLLNVPDGGNCSCVTGTHIAPEVFNQAVPTKE